MPDKYLIPNGNTLTLQGFANEVFNNLPQDIRENLLKRPRYYPELSAETLMGIDVYYFTIRRETLLGKNVPFSTVDKTIRDGYLYNITDEEYKKDRKRLGKYRDIECTLNSTMVVHKQGYDYGIKETPIMKSSLVKVSYESNIVKIYFRPVKLTKKNAKTLAGYIKVIE